MKNKCGDCHLCCEYFTIELTDVPQEALDYYSTWGISVQKVENKHVLAIYSPCKNLTEIGCSIYKKRPVYCREFNCGRIVDDGS